MQSCTFVPVGIGFFNGRLARPVVRVSRLYPPIPSPHQHKLSPPRANLPPNDDGQAISGKLSVSEILWRAPPAAVYVLYMFHLFVQSPTGPISAQESLQEALKLSLNFIYITPIMLPQLAPTLHPMLEGIFNVIVAWAVLLLGFVSEDNPPRNSYLRAEPFLIATAFLTNIFYLPYLILRAKPKDRMLTPATALQKLGESIYLPIFSLAVLGVSAAWAVFARPEFGDLATRFSSFKHTVSSNILAYSFGVDVLTFSLFQSWLVRDDANRRTWRSESVKQTAIQSTVVPFLGLAFYLIQRARHTTLPES